MQSLRVLLAVAAAWLAGGAGAASPASPLTRLPPLMLWAWERPEDLRFLGGRDIGVAWLDRTVTLTGAQMAVRLRQQPLRVAPSTALVAVVRIEADADAGPAADAARVAAEVARAAQRPGVTALQIDFDATTSQRQLYRRVLQELKRALPRRVSLSMTALASWCADDRWLDELPVDEAVPMLFEMGVDHQTITRRLQDGEPFGSARCHGAIGISTRERLRRLPAFDRAYVFNYRAWTPADVATALRGVER